METPTQTLHRLTSYTPGHRWDQPADDPRVVQGLQANDMNMPRTRGPQRRGQPPQRPAPIHPLPRSARPPG